MRIATNWAYALLKPDVILRGTISQVLTILEGSGFEVRQFRIGALTDEAYQAMYAAAFLWQLDHWSHNKEAYTFGPVIGLILNYSRTLHADATPQGVLHTLKGSALPRDLVPGTIRAAAFATSRVFNVIHVPEAFEVAEHEAVLWFGTGTPHSGCSNMRNALEAEVSAHGYSSGARLDAEATYLFVKARLMHAMQWQGATKEIMERLAALRQMYTDWANRILTVSEHTTRKSLCSEWQGRESKELEDLLNISPCRASMTIDLNRLAALLRDLHAQRVPTSNCLSFLWSQLAVARVYVSSLERYLITTKVLYFGQ